VCLQTPQHEVLCLAENISVDCQIVLLFFLVETSVDAGGEEAVAGEEPLAIGHQTTNQVMTNL